METLTTTIEQAFEQCKFKKADEVLFEPEVKIKRAHDTLYISKIKKFKNGNLLATVEVYDGKLNDKAPMPINLLDDRAINTLINRMLGIIR